MYLHYLRKKLGGKWEGGGGGMRAYYNFNDKNF